MRFSDGTTSSLHVTSLEAQSHPHPPGLANIFHPPIPPPQSLNTISPYHQDPTACYPGHAPHTLISRLGSNTPSSGMSAHAHRSTTLPGPQISAREQYASDTPSFRRQSEHPSRSPSYPSGTLRGRTSLMGPPSPAPSFTSPIRMEAASYGPKPPGEIPPLGPITTIGHLEYIDAGNVTPAKCDINGTIDKGFFLADGEWTCYRRNYFQCNCSFVLTPSYPGTAVQYVRDGTAYPVLGFAMSISAIVSDDTNQTIELVQHTPKRDKGPVQKPDKIRLAPKQPHQHMSMYPHDPTLGPASRSIYDPTGFSAAPQGPGSFQTEYTFERIQFKQATANNGKRRAAQQYYNLCVELWVECGGNMPDPFMKIAYKKSAKMIVRGRSPGHYSDNRRNSTSSGPGGSAGSLSGFTTGGMLGTEFPQSAGLPSSAYTPQYDTRGGPPPGSVPYGSLRDPRDILHGGVIPPEESKAIHSTKEYQYYPAAVYEHQDTRDRIDVWSHPEHHHEHENLFPPPMAAGFDSINKIKNESEAGIHGPGMALRSLFNPGPLVPSQRCGPSDSFKGKPSSGGYYPTMMPSPGMGLNIT